MVSDHERRRALKEAYAQTPPKAGVYRFVNTANGKSFVDAAVNLKAAESKLTFAQSTGTVGVMFRKMSEDIRTFGIDAFRFEVLEVLEQEPGVTSAQIAADLKVMATLWRESYDPDLLY